MIANDITSDAQAAPALGSGPVAASTVASGPTGWLGSMARTVEIVGDIVSTPAEPNESWEALD